MCQISTVKNISKLEMLDVPVLYQIEGKVFAGNLFQSQHEGCLGTPPTLEVNGYKRLRLCNVPTIKQTWLWQISFESPFTKRLNPTICRTQYSHKIHLRQEESASNSLLMPQSSTPLRSSVRQPLFFLFFLSISKEPISCSVGQGFEPQ